MGWWPDALNPFKGRAMSPRKFEERRKMIALAGEVEAMGDMFTRMNRQCYQKCCNQRILDGMDYNDELSLDDERCLESCATKFMATQHMVGAIFMSEAQAEQSKMEQ
mmetsp:Transcript_18851/g.45298  ORF Transcript_18851/g.45298 Transcript_18851/m.45298 type:complete len:107 (-) Transcript_18851:112-432(-)